MKPADTRAPRAAQDTEAGVQARSAAAAQSHRIHLFVALHVLAVLLMFQAAVWVAGHWAAVPEPMVGMQQQRHHQPPPPAVSKPPEGAVAAGQRALPETPVWMAQDLQAPLRPDEWRRP